MPESVKRRGSSGPTTGAIVRCSPAVAMCQRLLRDARRAADRRTVERAVGELEQLEAGHREHYPQGRRRDAPPPEGVAAIGLEARHTTEPLARAPGDVVGAPGGVQPRV